MTSFQYTIKDPMGIHARPAGLLAKAAKATGSSITITKDERTVSADRLLSLMGLGIRCGDTITVTVEGDNEAAAAQAIKDFLEENL